MFLGGSFNEELFPEKSQEAVGNAMLSLLTRMILHLDRQRCEPAKCVSVNCGEQNKKNHMRVSTSHRFPRGKMDPLLGHVGQTRRGGP